MQHSEVISSQRAPTGTTQSRRLSLRIWCIVQRMIAGVALVLLLPVFAVLYPVVRLTSPGPFIYMQRRPGLRGVAFRAYKIRTMQTGADRNAAAARSVKSSDPMVTAVGRVLRDLKLDELPQLYNVVKGDMTLVGPRPIAISFQAELESKIPGFSSRLLVKPGITSLPQVCILESDDPEHVVADWTRRFRMEQHYIARQCVRYDLIVIALTFALIARKALATVRGVLWRLRSLLAAASAILLVAALSGCASFDAGGLGGGIPEARITPVSSEVSDSLEARAPVTVSPLKVKPMAQGDADPDYRVGGGDVLKVNVFGEAGMNDLTLRVESDGRIQLPAVESQKVSGLTLREIQKKLQTAYASEFNAPWVMVTIETFGSRPIYLLGEFNSPGISYLQRPTSLLNAVALGGGTTPKAHLPGARVIRGNTILPVDIKAVLKDGRLENNIWLKAGDTIFVPGTEDLKFYVVGAVQAPGVFSFGDGRQTLVRALAAAGGPVTGKASLRKVVIIRTLSAVEGQAIEVDAAEILAGKGQDVDLRPDDIVFVAQSGLSRWNEVVQQLLPTLSLIGAPIQPFMALGVLGTSS